jgi:hypothetical protein
VAAGKAEKCEEDNRENNDAIAVELTGADKASVFDGALYCCIVRPSGGGGGGAQHAFFRGAAVAKHEPK